MIYSMSESVTDTSESLMCTFTTFQLHSFLLLNHHSWGFFFLSFSLFLSFYNSVPEAIEPSLCVPLRGETAVKNILLFMSNFPSSHSPAQIKHATFREKEGKKLWVISSCNRINAGFPLLFDCYSVQVVMTLRWFWTLRLSVSTCRGGKERFAICVGQVELVYFGFSQVEDLLCFCLLDKLEV